MGGALGAELYGSNSLIVLSAPQVRSFLSLVHDIPLTIFSCAWACHISCRLVRFQTLIIPSPLPDAKCSSLHVDVRYNMQVYNGICSRFRVLGKTVDTIYMAGLETCKKWLREHALQLCRIESSGVFSCSFEGMQIGVEIARLFGDI
jgi:hypothetical protein